MFGINAGESKTYGVKFQARCITAQEGEKQHTRFLIGTLSLREENEVHLIQLADDGSDVVCEGFFAHQHEIWDLAACPFNPRLFSTVYASAGEYYAAIWRLPADKYGSQTLELAGQLLGLDAPVRKVLWHGGQGQTWQVVSLDEETLRVWDLSAPSSSVVSERAKASAGTLQHIGTGAWDPHNASVVATTSEGSISLWDLRSMSKTSSVDAAHSMQVRDVDFNPNQPNILMSTGDDSKIRVWDLRAMSRTPLAELPGHAHWTWRARYNSFHDELVLSCGTDSTVHLWHVPSSSSSTLNNPLKAGFASTATAVDSAGQQQQQQQYQGLDQHRQFGGSRVGAAAGHQGVGAAAAKLPGARGPLDQLAASFTDFEDSVYGIAWSAVDPWVFASLSYDGRVVLDVVPPSVRSRCR